MSEGTILHPIPEKWMRGDNGQVAAIQIPEAVPGETYYRVSGEALAALLYEAGWVPFEET